METIKINSILELSANNLDTTTCIVIDKFIYTDTELSVLVDYLCYDAECNALFVLREYGKFNEKLKYFIKKTISEFAFISDIDVEFDNAYKKDIIKITLSPDFVAAGS